jgi:hypothetical protein
MTNDFPVDHSVPLKLKKEIDKAKGREKVFLYRLVEGLLVSSKTPEDVALVRKYFD